MSKRVADKYITDQNWDKEDPPHDGDDKGEFRKATHDILKNRVIRKAKRRATAGQQAEMSAFSGFSGLKAPTDAATSGTTTFRGFTTSSVNIAHSQGTNGPSVKSSDDEESSQKTEYNTHLSALNRSVSNWIKSHVEKNPLCDLTPIFNDYKKYLADIDEKYGQSDTEGSQASKSASSDSQETTSPVSNKLSLHSNVSNKPKFSLTGFGQKSDSQVKNTTIASMEGPKLPATQPKFTGFQVNTGGSPFKGFGQSNLSKPAGFTGFSFSSSMVATKTQEESSQQSAKAEDEEYVPPKPESNVIEEEDALYSIRCKLYYKKEDTYADRGVGQLYLKPSGSKTQLLIRADTAISQVLLNILITSVTPIQRQGKNNIMVMCIPNPAINEKEKDKVVAMLIRVKTGDDADQLFSVLEQKKAEATES